MALTELGEHIANGLDRDQSPMTDEQLNAAAQVMTVARDTANKHRPPLMFLIDLGPAYMGPIIVKSHENEGLCSLGIALVKLNVEKDVSKADMMLGWQTLKREQQKVQESQRPYHMSDEAVDECQRGFHEAINLCNQHGLPALLYTVFGRYGSGEDSTVHDMMLESDTASESFTGLQWMKTLIGGDLDRIYEYVKGDMLVQVIASDDLEAS